MRRFFWEKGKNGENGFWQNKEKEIERRIEEGEVQCDCHFSFFGRCLASVLVLRDIADLTLFLHIAQ